MLSGSIPARILRAAQFHEFVSQLVDWGTQGDVGYVPKMRTQLVAARSVAEELVKLATNPDSFSKSNSASSILEIAGPRPENLFDVAVKLAARRGSPQRIELVSDTGDPDQDLYESGGLLPGSEAILAGPTFEEWLASTPYERGRSAA